VSRIELAQDNVQCGCGTSGSAVTMLAVVAVAAVVREAV
jgi:uncharacterized protein (TIGR03382 family)